MRDLQHYLETFRDNDRVGRQILARAIHVARHGPEELSEPTADDIGKIARGLGDETWTTTSEKAVQRLLVERARAEVAPDSRPGTAALARELDVAENTIRKWLRGDRRLSGPARKMVEQIAGVE